MKYYHIPVRESTYKRLEKYRAHLSLLQGERISLDKAVRTLLDKVEQPTKRWGE